MYRLILLATTMASLASARTDLEGCTSTDVSSPAGASLAYYVPDTGEICAFLDCGGGRAPPKTTVPGCPQYSGTLTYSPSYLPGYAAAMETGSGASSSNSEAVSATAPSMAEMTSAAIASSTASDSSESASALASASSSTSDESTLMTSSASTESSSTSTAVGVASSGTTSIGRSSSRGGGVTATSDVASQETNAAMEARVWVAGVAMVGLGAVVAGL